MYVELLQMGGYYVVLCLLLCVAVLLLIIFQDSFSSLPISHMWKKYLFCMCTMGKKCLSTASVCVCVCVCVCSCSTGWQSGAVAAGSAEWRSEVHRGLQALPEEESAAPPHDSLHWSCNQQQGQGKLSRVFSN